MQNLLAEVHGELKRVWAKGDPGISRSPLGPVEAHLAVAGVRSSCSTSRVQDLVDHLGDLNVLDRDSG